MTLRLHAFHIGRAQAVRILDGGHDINEFARCLWHFHWPGLFVTTFWEPLEGRLHVYAQPPVSPTHETEQRRYL